MLRHPGRRLQRRSSANMLTAVRDHRADRSGAESGSRAARSLVEHGLEEWTSLIARRRNELQNGKDRSTVGSYYRHRTVSHYHTPTYGVRSPPIYTLGLVMSAVAESQHRSSSRQGSHFRVDDLLLPSLFTCPLLQKMLRSDGADLD